MAERLTIEHYIGEAFVKVAQVILGSRLFTASQGPNTRVQRDKKAGRWFHLELDDVDMAREAEAWRKDTSAPMVVEVYVQHPSLSRAASGRHVDLTACATEAHPAVEVLVERWTVQYVKGAGTGAAGAAGGSGSGAADGSAGGGGSGGGGGSSGSRTYLDETSVYKRLVILIRSLYSYTRVLPAHKLYRASKRHLGEHPSGFRLACRVSRSMEAQQQQVGSSIPSFASSSAHCSGPTAPQPRMQHFTFAPVDTLGGQFRAAVQFLPASSGALAFLAAAEDQAVSAVGIGVAASPPVLVPGAGAGPGAGPGGVGAHIIPDYYASSHGAGERGAGGMGGAGLPLPSTSAPSTSSGFARPPYGPSPASSRYGGYGASGRSPPVGSGTPGGGGILRHAPTAGGLPPGGAGSGGGGGAPMAVPARSVVRHAWSSKDMKVSFSLPPPFGSPGGLGAGGVAGSLGRRSSSGYGGSTPSTPPVQSPGARAPGHPGSHSSHHHRHHSSGAATAAALAPQQREGHPVGSQPNPTHSHHMHAASRHGAIAGSGAAATTSVMGSSPPSLPSSDSGGGGGGRPPLASGRRASSSGSAVAAAAPRSPKHQQQEQQLPADTGGSVISEGPFARASPGVGGVHAAVHAEAARAGGGAATKAAATEGTVTDIDVDAVLRGDIKGGDLPYRTAVAAGGGGGEGGGTCTPATAQGVERGQEDAAVAAAAVEPRGATAPVAIPGRTSCRTRSVSDLRAPAVYGGFEVKDAVAAAAATGGWRAAAAAGGQHLAEEDSGGGGAAASHDASVASAADGTPTGSVAATPGGGGAHCRMALGSAPAAPRGMLGLALGAMKPPAGPLGAAGGSRGLGGVVVGSASAHGAWAGAGGKAAAAAEGEERPPGSAAKDAAAAEDDSSGGCGGAGGTSTALTVTVVQRNVAAPAAAAAAGAAGASPPGRPVAGAGAMVVARAGGVAVGSLAGCGSPQLPFAFTPSAASMSLASLHQAIAVPLGYFPPGSSGGTPRGALPPPGHPHHPHAHHPQQQQPGSISGRDITALATIKRPSWGSRSSSFDPASMGTHGMALIPALGPLHDLLESSSPSTTASTPNRSGTSGANPHPDSQQQHHPHPASAVFSLSPGSGASRGSSVGTLQQQQQQRSSPLHPASFVAKAMAEKPAAAAAAAAAAPAAAGGAAVQDGTSCAVLGTARNQATAAAAAAGAAPPDPQDAAQGAPSPAQDASAAPGVTALATATGAPLCGRAGARAVPYGTTAAHAGLGGLCGLAREDSESDLLPFALDTEAPSALNPSVAAALNAAVAAAAGDCGGGAGTRPAGPVEVTLSIPTYTTHAERDVAVGAFVRMVAEAAPLAAPLGHPAARELTPAAALAELRELAALIRDALQGG